VIEKESHLLPLYFDGEMATQIEDIFRSRGADLLLGREMVGVKKAGKGISMTFSEGSGLKAEVLVAAVGVRPRTELLSDTGVEMDRGILVDWQMQTSMEGIYAAGDVAQAPDFLTGQPVLNPILPSAMAQGRVAGDNMAGKDTKYEGSLPMNVFNFFGHTAVSVGYPLLQGEGIQVIEETNAAGKQSKRLVLQEGKLIGAALLNIPVDPGVIQYLIRKRLNLEAEMEPLMMNTQDTGRRLMLQAEWQGA
jgi:phenylglyoxylate dehydrogenase epsilon subunit